MNKRGGGGVLYDNLHNPVHPGGHILCVYRCILFWEEVIGFFRSTQMDPQEMKIPPNLSHSCEMRFLQHHKEATDVEVYCSQKENSPRCPDLSQLDPQTRRAGSSVCKATVPLEWMLFSPGHGGALCSLSLKG